MKTLGDATLDVRLQRINREVGHLAGRASVAIAPNDVAREINRQTYTAIAAHDRQYRDMLPILPLKDWSILVLRPALPPIRPRVSDVLEEQSRLQVQRRPQRLDDSRQDRLDADHATLYNRCRAARRWRRRCRRPEQLLKLRRGRDVVRLEDEPVRLHLARPIDLEHVHDALDAGARRDGARQHGRAGPFQESDVGRAERGEVAVVGLLQQLLLCRGHRARASGAKGLVVSMAS